MIREANLKDAKQISEIYNYYILNSIVTFEEVKIDETEMSNRIKSVSSKFPWIVYEENNQIQGYAYATEWKPRHAYKHSAESTVYLAPNAFKKGIGTSLYLELINKLKNMHIHSIMGGISLPNEASITLHEKLGFAKVAHFKEVGYKFEEWIDVGYWQLTLR